LSYSRSDQVIKWHTSCLDQVSKYILAKIFDDQSNLEGKNSFHQHIFL
jgi:hypothetical protein